MAVMPANLNLNTREQYVLVVPGDPKSSGTGRNRSLKCRFDNTEKSHSGNGL